MLTEAGRLAAAGEALVASDPATAERELRALADAAAVFPKAICTLITLHQTGFPKLALPAKTRVVTAWQWLLG
jgi:hypothetical protein